MDLILEPSDDDATKQGRKNGEAGDFRSISHRNSIMGTCNSSTEYFVGIYFKDLRALRAVEDGYSVLPRKVARTRTKALGNLWLIIRVARRGSPYLGSKKC